MNHDVMSIDECVGDDCITVITCRCSKTFSAETADEARRRHGVHHRSPDAGAGLAAAREALEGKGKT